MAPRGPTSSRPRAGRRHRPGALLLAALLVVGAAGVGCSRGDPWTEPVWSTSAAAYTTWHSRVAENMPAERRKQVDQALQDIRFKIMGDRAATGSAAIEGELRRRIDGRPLREVVQWGVELRLERLRGEFAGLKGAMNANLRLVTRPGDSESRRHLDGVEARQKQRLDDLSAAITAAEQELAPLAAATGRTFAGAGAGEPDRKPELIK
jgi:hypothetical protein